MWVAYSPISFPHREACPGKMVVLEWCRLVLQKAVSAGPEIYSLPVVVMGDIQALYEIGLVLERRVVAGFEYQATARCLGRYIRLEINLYVCPYYLLAGIRMKG